MKELRICEIRADTTAEKKDLTLVGRAIVYDYYTIINDAAENFTEVIRNGALDETDLTDARLLYNHDLSKIPLAKTPKTMQLIKDSAGLKMVAHLLDTEEAKSVYTAVKRGDLSGMSFAFKVPSGGDKYNPKTNTREIFKISEIYEISIVPFPAYPQTSVEARSMLEKINAPKRAEMKIKINQILRRVI